MAVNVDPPIQLQPDTPHDQEITFINQNFQAITNAVNKTGFVIVGSGTTSLAAPSVTYNNNVTSNFTSVTIAHGLGYAPAVLAYMTAGGNNFSMPLSSMIDPLTNLRGNYQFIETSYSANSTSITFQNKLTISDSGSGTAAGLALVNITYYFLQQASG